MMIFADSSGQRMIDPRSSVAAGTPGIPGANAVARYARLVFADSRGQELERDLMQSSTLIGSAHGCDIHLLSPDIADAHCLILNSDQGLSIRSLSTNFPTLVNSLEVRETPLKDGDTISMGRHRFRVETNLNSVPKSHCRIGDYDLTELLGSGGMSWIFGARQISTGRRVALKMLPGIHSRRMRAHFELEARAGYRLNHPRVIRTERVEKFDRMQMIVMEHYESITLQEFVTRNGPLPWPQACHIARQAAEGLVHVHSLGLVHRDLKPGNLLIGQDGSVKLIDFGLALIRNDQRQAELAQLFRRHILGTADYISPEQSLDSDHVDARADLYSLGGVLYFTLTGQVLYPISGVHEKLDAHRKAPLPNLREQITDAPEEVIEILEMLLAKKPEERLPSASDVVVRLRPLAKRHTIPFSLSEVLTDRADLARKRWEKLRERAFRRNPDTPELPPEGRILSELGVIVEPSFDPAFNALPVTSLAALNEVVNGWPKLSPESRENVVKTLRKELELPHTREPQPHPNILDDSAPPIVIEDKSQEALSGALTVVVPQPPSINSQRNPSIREISEVQLTTEDDRNSPQLAQTPPGIAGRDQLTVTQLTDTKERPANPASAERVPSLTAADGSPFFDSRGLPHSLGDRDDSLLVRISAESNEISLSR